MSPRTSALKNYMETHNALPPDTVLGYIAMFSIREDAYDDAKMREAFTRLNLRTDLLPLPLKADDAFEKASKAVDKTKYPLVGGQEAEVMIREAGRDDKNITRRLVREVKDAHHRKLAYGEVGDLVFYKAQEKNGRIDPATVRCRADLRGGLSDSEREPLTKVLDRFRSLYDQYRNYHDAQKIRTVMRGYMNRLDAIMWKQSVYYVPATHADEVHRLGEWVNSLTGGEMDLIPLPDLPHLRDRVVEVYQREAEAGLTEVAEEIAKVIDRRNLKPETFERVKAMYDDWMAKADRYTSDLSISQARTAGAVEAVQLQLAQLQNQVIRQLNTATVGG